MKVSKLINELIELKKKHGDVEVFAEDPDYGDGNAYQVTRAKYESGSHLSKEGVVLWHHWGSYCRSCGRGCD